MNNIQTNNISIPVTTTTNVNISSNNNNNNSNDLPHLQQCELEISNNTNTHEIHSNITNPPNTISPEQHITITNTTNHQQQHQQHYPPNNIQSLNNVEILQGQTNPPKVNKSHSKPLTITNTHTNDNNNTNKSFYENFDVQQMIYSIVKDYSQLKISKDESFMERMKFDIYKRQIKEDKINKLVEQNKNKIDEEDRIRAFNRLIEDANRRIEAQENLDLMRNRLEADLIGPPAKKYTKQEWKEIYNERFLHYLIEANKKKEEKIKEKRQHQQKEEEEEVAMCKHNKKAKRKYCEESGKRMYEEAGKRKLRMEERIKKLNLENEEVNELIKGIKPTMYKFMSDNEGDDNDNRGDKQLTVTGNKKYKQNSKAQLRKDKYITNTQFNNKRFETDNTKYHNKYHKQPLVNINKQKEYIEKYIHDDNDNNNNNNNNQHQYTISNPIKDHLPHTTTTNNNVQPHPTTITTTNIAYPKESDASRIVDQFFTQNLKHIH
jgi:hypothetical protein